LLKTRKVNKEKELKTEMFSQKVMIAQEELKGLEIEPIVNPTLKNPALKPSKN
jgi:hypothetical protein